MEMIKLSSSNNLEEVFLYKGCRITAYNKTTFIFDKKINVINAKIKINGKIISLVEVDGGKLNSMEHARNQAIKFIDTIIK